MLLLLAQHRPRQSTERNEPEWRKDAAKSYRIANIRRWNDTGVEKQC